MAEAFDKEGEARLVTLNGEHVASQEERLIANWLFYNGVEYAYEKPYEHDTTTTDYRQYVPDFYHPKLSLYHEHFAFDADGQAPAHFQNYAQGAAWKRETHATHGTELIESTSHQLRTGEIFGHLTRELTSRGVVLDPNPDRPTLRQAQETVSQVHGVYLSTRTSGDDFLALGLVYWRTSLLHNLRALRHL